jgi:DNA processing protein
MSINSKGKFTQNDKIKAYLSRKLLGSNYGSEHAKSDYQQLQNSFYCEYLLNNSENLEYLNYLRKAKVHIIGFWEEDFPQQLKYYKGCPAMLFCKGRMEHLNKVCICVVGAREMSDYGNFLVKWVLDKYLVQIKEGGCVISGLARGVDYAVHKGCIENSIPTIGVVAGGLDQGFPQSSAELCEYMGQKELVISEFPPGRKVIKGMFPMRNRVMAMLAEKVVVVEASDKSGSLITARYAADYGKEVFAFPHSINKTNSKGNNRLISEGCNIIYDDEGMDQFLSSINSTN